MIRRFALHVFCLLMLATAARGDGPADNDPNKVRRVPRQGIEVSAADRARLEAGLRKLAESIERLRRGGDARVPRHARLRGATARPVRRR